MVPGGNIHKKYSQAVNIKLNDWRLGQYPRAPMPKTVPPGTNFEAGYYKVYIMIYANSCLAALTSLMRRRPHPTDWSSSYFFSSTSSPPSVVPWLTVPPRVVFQVSGSSSCHIPSLGYTKSSHSLRPVLLCHYHIVSGDGIVV